ncbi:cytochrome ubiquinol oxidase subunit I [Devriesea agamarum]|uniref:cytochrome ubiquinol oxidase subunit I n=1 Tax=Devriesea agamarum TaxID=472569 RepID=UPI00071CC7CA|nr:cytochrome ubiquinol oxidase subunit I [Devriesea agamarum]
MEALDLARWQFGITTVYHFIFVPLTIGLSLMVAIMQTVATFSKDEVKRASWTRLTKFFGQMLLINFGVGIATGIVQEFQFGMNWSEYSRFVGDIFGAPLAFEGLAAFFMESTFLGLWMFGWDRLPKKIHLLMIWLVAVGTTLSAYFILAANSFMQHPVAAVFNPETGRAELDQSQGGILALLTNVTTLAAFPHVIAGAWLVAAAFVAGIATWHLVRHTRKAQKLGASSTEGKVHLEQARRVFRPAVRFGVIAMVIAGVLVIVTGDFQAKIMFKQQPMKMASAEALCNTTTGADFSILAVGSPDAFSADCSSVSHLISLPKVTSFLATNDPNATLQGVEDLQKEYQKKFGDTVTTADGQSVKADYRPNLFVTYWSFRLMMGFAIFSAILCLWALWATRKKQELAGTTTSRVLAWFAVLAIPMPFLANAFGWIFTEMGRQPWVVAPSPDGDPLVRLMTMQGVSNHPSWVVVTSLVVFTLVYGILAVVWFGLMRRYAAKGIPLPDTGKDGENESSKTPALSFGY